MCLELAVEILMSVAVTKNTNMVHLVRGYLPTDTKEPCTSAREVPQDVPVRVPEDFFCKKKLYTRLNKTRAHLLGLVSSIHPQKPAHQVEFLGQWQDVTVDVEQIH